MRPRYARKVIFPRVGCGANARVSQSAPVINP
jgi:hypothetical protein